MVMMVLISCHDAFRMLHVETSSHTCAATCVQIARSTVKCVSAQQWQLAFLQSAPHLLREWVQASYSSFPTGACRLQSAFQYAFLCTWCCTMFCFTFLLSLKFCCTVVSISSSNCGPFVCMQSLNLFPDMYCMFEWCIAWFLHLLCEQYPYMWHTVVCRISALIWHGVTKLGSHSLVVTGLKYIARAVEVMECPDLKSHPICIGLLLTSHLMSRVISFKLLGCT